jgi:hypothetical protein
MSGLSRTPRTCQLRGEMLDTSGSPINWFFLTQKRHRFCAARRHSCDHAAPGHATTATGPAGNHARFVRNAYDRFGVLQRGIGPSMQVNVPISALKDGEDEHWSRHLSDGARRHPGLPWKPPPPASTSTPLGSSCCSPAWLRCCTRCCSGATCPLGVGAEALPAAEWWSRSDPSGWSRSDRSR